ncbi:MAG: spore coat protein GerQ [Planctomycetes bacterium]|nr:spore coat protein GerQ [Planctomycetota bacterium]
MRCVNMIEVDLAVLVIIDVQTKMLAAIGSNTPDQIVERIGKLVQAAELFDIPVLFTEQYPAGLGETDARLKESLQGRGAPIIKNTCSCWRDEVFRGALQKTGREHVIVAGLETHVCIQQTVLDLIRVDYVPFVPVDACSSRFAGDASTAVERMRRGRGNDNGRIAPVRAG